MKPRLFIGSSRESLEISYTIQTSLSYDADVTVWSQGIFQLSSNTLDDLIITLDKSDFGAFVFSLEDLVMIRDQQFLATRDNVVLELGLFIGRLGKKRSFFILPQGQKDFRLPTDLLGVTPATFDPNRPDRNLAAILGPACQQIRNAMKSWMNSDLLEMLSPRLVYLLRHMAQIDDYRPHEYFGKALAAYDRDAEELSSHQESSAWGWAAYYACRYLHSIKLVKLQAGSGSRVAITELGKALIRSSIAQSEFKLSFQKPLRQIG